MTRMAPMASSPIVRRELSTTDAARDAMELVKRRLFPFQFDRGLPGVVCLPGPAAERRGRTSGERRIAGGAAASKAHLSGVTDWGPATSPDVVIAVVAMVVVIAVTAVIPGSHRASHDPTRGHWPFRHLPALALSRRMPRPLAWTSASRCRSGRDPGSCADPAAAFSLLTGGALRPSWHRGGDALLLPLPRPGLFSVLLRTSPRRCRCALRVPCAIPGIAGPSSSDVGASRLRSLRACCDRRRIGPCSWGASPRLAYFP